MTLPKIDKPTFEMTIPSSKKTVTFRPFLVKEEKILLIAQQSDDDKDIIRALSQILNNCILDESFNVSSLTTFDLEYMFLKLRAKSVNNIVTLQYQDNDDEKIYTFNINLDDVEVQYQEDHSNIIKIDDKIGIIMKYPSITIAENVPTSGDPIETMDYLVLSCIDKVYSEEEIYDNTSYTPEELKEFIDSLDVASYDKIRLFFESMPKMYYKIEYKNSDDKLRTIELTSLRDFFSWG